MISNSGHKALREYGERVLPYDTLHKEAAMITTITQAIHPLLLVHFYPLCEKPQPLQSMRRDASMQDESDAER